LPPLAQAIPHFLAQRPDLQFLVGRAPVAPAVKVRAAEGRDVAHGLSETPPRHPVEGPILEAARDGRIGRFIVEFGGQMLVVRRAIASC
jgi:hypothetical protein